MKAGPLNNRIVVEAKASGDDAQDSFGGPQELWTTAFETWAAFEPVGGREFPVGQKVVAETSARFRIRYIDGITADRYRIRFRGKTWNILNVGPGSDPDDPARRTNVELRIEVSEIQ